MFLDLIFEFFKIESGGNMGGFVMILIDMHDENNKKTSIKKTILNKKLPEKVSLEQKARGIT